MGSCIELHKTQDICDHPRTNQVLQFPGKAECARMLNLCIMRFKKVDYYESLAIA